jgi:hypothetical protein
MVAADLEQFALLFVLTCLIAEPIMRYAGL